MDLNAADLAAQGLDVSWDGPRGLLRRVVLAPSGGVTGLYSVNPERHRLDAGTEEALVLAELDWPLAEGHVHLHGEAPLTRLTVDLTIPRGDGATKGEIGAAGLTVPAVDLELPSLGQQPLKLAGLTLFDVAIAFDEGALVIVAESGELDRLNVTVGGTEVALEAVALEGLKAQRLDGAWTVHVAVASAGWARVETSATSVRLTTVDLRRLRFADGDLSVGNVTAAELDLRVPDLRREAADERDEPNGDGRASLDLSALDRLNGKIDVDLTADTTAPIIGVRRATHHFRLGVDHGALNYYRLEKSLSALEDALLDFRVIDRRLLLVADVPFVSLDKKTVVSWPLRDAEELALAERHLVRLRRLIDYQLPRRASEAPKSGKRTKAKSSFEVRELRFDGIDVELRWSGGDRVELPAGGALVLGAPNRPAVAALAVRGGLRYAPREASAGGLEIVAERIRFGVDEVPLGSRLLDLDRLRCDTLTAQLDFAGLSPRSFEGKLAAVRLRGLSLRSANR